MADISVHPSSVETVHMFIRAEHPINGETNLSSLVIEVAMPVDGVAPSTWVTTAWETGTAKIAGKRYYAAKINLGTDFTLSNGNIYQSHGRITVSGSNKAYVKGGRVNCTNV